MKVLLAWPQRQIALCLIIFMIAPMGQAATAHQSLAQVGTLLDASVSESQLTPQGDGKAAPQDMSSSRLPDDPGLIRAQAANQDHQIATGQPSAQSLPVQQGTSAPPQKTAPAPVGTAAAPYENPEGVPASRPAGAAIAPAKQRRAKSFSIRIALLAGAAVAIGVVTAASLSSPKSAH